MICGKNWMQKWSNPLLFFIKNLDVSHLTRDFSESNRFALRAGHTTMSPRELRNHQTFFRRSVFVLSVKATFIFCLSTFTVVIVQHILLLKSIQYFRCLTSKSNFFLFQIFLHLAAMSNFIPCQVPAFVKFYINKLQISSAANCGSCQILKQLRISCDVKFLIIQQLRIRVKFYIGELQIKPQKFDNSCDLKKL